MSQTESTSEQLSKIIISPELQGHLDSGNKAFALRKWEDAAAAFTSALEFYAEEFGDFSPQSADVLLLYGKALLEIAIAQNQVMRAEQEGAEQADEDVDDDEDEDAPEDIKAHASKLSNHFVFNDEGDDPEAQSSSAGAGSSGAAAATTAAAADASNGGGPDAVVMANPDEEEPEDDFNAAWEVLDAARALFGGMESAKARLQEADCLITLGDISLETENFPQAVQDFRSALELKLPLLPSSSRQLSEAHLKLGMALEFDPSSDSRPLALEHLEKAKASLLARQMELRTGVSGFVEEGPSKGKGTGEAVPEGLVKDRVEGLSKEDRGKEVVDIEELVKDLDVKIEDLRTAPASDVSAFNLLNSSSKPSNAAASTSSVPAGPVNDLSGMVKKKKAAPAAKAAAESLPTEKRKAEEKAEGNGKKTRAM